MSTTTNIAVRPAPAATDLQDLRVDSERQALPKNRYTSRAMWQAETEKLWAKVWQWACLVDDLPEAGCYAEYQILDQSVLITRDEDLQLHAFHNVCMHRGNRLRTGSGKNADVACRYHSWTWNLDGSLKEITDEEGFHNLDKSCLGLQTVSMDVWQGFVFINLDRDAEPLADYLAPMDDKLGAYRFGQHVRTRSATMPVGANWKTVVDGFVEVYHLHAIHPQLIPFLDDVNTTYDVWGAHSAMYQPIGIASPRLADTSDRVVLDSLAEGGSGYSGKMLRKSPYFSEVDGVAQMQEGVTVRQAVIDAGRMDEASLGLDYGELTDDQLVDDYHYFIFPNIILNVFSGHFIASRIRPDPVDHESCFFDMFVFDMLTDEQKAARPPSKHVILEKGVSVGRVPDQDFTQLPTVQKGLHSNGFAEVLLSDQECRVLAFHQEVDRYVFGTERSP